MNKMSEWQRGYIAGLFDGEGCVRITKDTRTASKPYYRASIEIKNTNREALDIVELIAGSGKVYLYSRKNPKPQWKPCYTYQLHDMLAIYFWLYKIYPYLIIKRERAKVVMEFIKCCLTGKCIKSREEYYLEMKELNK